MIQLSKNYSLPERPHEPIPIKVVGVGSAGSNVLDRVLLDGMDKNDRAIGTQVVRPPVEAIQEFKVLTNLYGADLGRTGGGVISLVS